MTVKSAYDAIVGLIYRLAGLDGVCYVGGAVSLPPPLPAETENELIERAQTDIEARKTLVEHNLRLVVYIAKRFENTGVGIEDLISIGTIGLMKAVTTFKPNKQIKLATYASRCIENEILMFLRKTTCQRSEVSLDEPLKIDYDGNELLLSDLLGTDGDFVYRRLEESEERKTVRRALCRLSPRDRNIIELRFGITYDGSEGKEYTQKEVADMLGISQSYISRLEKRILSRLYEYLTSEKY